MTDRDKALAEAMGWTKVRVSHSGLIFGTNPKGLPNNLLGQSGSWELFGKHWEWAQEQDWFAEFILLEHVRIHHRINEEYKWLVPLFKPSVFADRLYSFLQVIL